MFKTNSLKFNYRIIALLTTLLLFSNSSKILASQLANYISSDVVMCFSGTNTGGFYTGNIYPNADKPNNFSDNANVYTWYDIRKGYSGQENFCKQNLGQYAGTLTLEGGSQIKYNNYSSKPGSCYLENIDIESVSAGVYGVYANLKCPSPGPGPDKKASNQSITNGLGNNLVLCFNGVQPKGAGNLVLYKKSSNSKALPLDTIGALVENGATIMLEAALSPKGYAGANFNVRQGGCSESNNYIANLNMTTNPEINKGNDNIWHIQFDLTVGEGKDKVTYSNSDNATKKGPLICDSYPGGAAKYGCTISKLNHLSMNQLPANPSVYSNVPMRGVNLSGAEWGQGNSNGGQENKDYVLPTKELAAYFAQKGMNSFRIPIRWEYLTAGKIQGPIDSDYIDPILNLISELTENKYHVILDLHNYMRFCPGNYSGGCSNIVTKQDISYVWSALAKYIKNKKIPNVVTNLTFEVMNEPNTMGTQQAFDLNMSGAASIRAIFPKNLIIVDGNQWTGLHSWGSASGTNGKTNYEVFTNSDNIDQINSMKPLGVVVHQYFDQDFSGKNTTPCKNIGDKDSMQTALNFDNFKQFMQKVNIPVFVTEFGSAYSEQCGADVNSFLTNIINASPAEGITSTGFAGWMWWTSGPWCNGPSPFLANCLNSGGAANRFIEGGILNNFLTRPSIN